MIELYKISKSYDRPGTLSQTKVLEEISWNVEENESIAIVGPSGSGKSTLLNILGTLDAPTSGQYLLCGIDIISRNDDQLAGIRNRMIGFVFQQHYLLPQLSLLENILLPLFPRKDLSAVKSARERAMHLIQRVGLNDHMKKLPSQLSLGECQRAAVVRALINQPKIILADEPTGSLDSENADHLGQLLVELNRDENVTLVVVTHSLSLAGRMKKKYKLVSGKLYPFGEHE